MRRRYDFRHLPPLPPGLYTCPDCGAVEVTTGPYLTPSVPHLTSCPLYRLPHAALKPLRKDPPTPEWPDYFTYSCRRCGGQAKHHPATRQLVGCVRCGYSTSAISTHFRYPNPDPARS